MRKQLLLFLLYALSINIQAQSEFDLLIESYTDSTNVLISEGREAIYQNIKNNKGEKNIEYLQKLNSKIDLNEYVILFEEEEQLVYFLSGNKELFLKSLEKIDVTEGLNLPVYDNFYDKCKVELESNFDFWENYIEGLGLNDEEQIIYDLFLSGLGLGVSKPKAYALTRKYQRNYNHSPYEPYVSGLKSVFQTGSMGYAMGSGVSTFKGAATKYFDMSGIVSFDMDYFINRIYFSTYLNINLKGKSLFEFEGYDEYDDFHIYEAGNRATHFSIGGKVGAWVYKNRIVKVYPYGSLSVANISVSHSDYDVESLTVSTGLSLGGGLGIDVALFNWRGSDLQTSQIVDHHIGLRLNAGGESVFTFTKTNDYSFLFVQAGIVWWMGD